MSSLKLLLVCATLRHAVGSAEHGHSSGGTPWEWSGIFATPDNTYEWVSQATKKDPDSDTSMLRFVDEQMKAVFLPVSSATDAILKDDAKASTGFEIDDAACEDVNLGATIVPAEGKCFMMKFPTGEFKEDSPDVTFKFQINTASISALAIYTAHVPNEFEYTSHYFMGGANFDEDVEPAFQTPISFEWGGIFDVSGDTEVNWISQRTSAGEDGNTADYKDPNMQMLIYNMGSKSAGIATLSELHRDYESHKTEWPACVDKLVTSEPVIPTTFGDAYDACFNFVFSSTHTSTFKINTAGVTSLAIFTAHGPTEFERDTHYLKKSLPICTDLVDTPGDECDIEAAAEGPPYEIVVVKEYRWGDVIGSSILVNLCTLLGVVIFLLGLSNFVKENADVFQAMCSSFAGGAILSFTFYLILVEASHYIAVGHPGEDEVEVTWRYGTVVLAGYVIAWFVEMVLSPFLNKNAGKPVEKPPADKVEEGGQDATAAVTWEDQKRIIVASLVGDGLHNMVDGFFIGTAFSYCTSSKGWKIAAVTIAHELAQELGDYVILTVNAGLKPVVALSINFLSGVSVLLGAIIAVGGDPSQETTGLLLAFGGGAYLHVAQECMVRVYGVRLTHPQKFVSFLLFTIGAVAIGLVLLDHEHCSKPKKLAAAAGAADPHAGHNH